MKPSCTDVHNKDMKIHEGSMRNNLIYNNITQIFSNEIRIF